MAEMTKEEAMKYLTVYANTGMRVSASADILYVNRKTMYKKLREAGGMFGVDPFDFYELAKVFEKEEQVSREEQLRKELDNALKALGLARDRLIETQEELRQLKWLLVQAEEGKRGANP